MRAPCCCCNQEAHEHVAAGACGPHLEGRASGVRGRHLDWRTTCASKQRAKHVVIGFLQQIRYKFYPQFASGFVECNRVAEDFTLCHTNALKQWYSMLKFNVIVPAQSPGCPGSSPVRFARAKRGSSSNRLSVPGASQEQDSTGLKISILVPFGSGLHEGRTCCQARLRRQQQRFVG